MANYARLLAKVVSGPGECWSWTAAVDRNGYSRIRWGGTARYAHRLFYELFVGPIGDGMTLDHLCVNTSCVNPGHLEAVSLRENVMRRPSNATAVNARKTHCKWGHPFSGENLIVRSRGTRACRACRQRDQMKRR